MTLNVFNDKWGLKRVSVYILYQLRLRQTIGYRRMDWTENSFIDDFGLKNSATIIFLFTFHMQNVTLNTFKSLSDIINGLTQAI